MGLNREITIKQELRPCMVNGQKALFHCWEHKKQVIPPSTMRGGHSGGEIAVTLGIIEREDGTIHEAYAYEIRFIDMKAEQYFFENATALDFEKIAGAGKENV